MLMQTYPARNVRVDLVLGSVEVHVGMRLLQVSRGVKKRTARSVPARAADTPQA